MGFFPHFREDLRCGVPFERGRQLEETVRDGRSRVDDALGNPLVIEVRNLLPQAEILEQRRPVRCDRRLFPRPA